MVVVASETEMDLKEDLIVDHQEMALETVEEEVVVAEASAAAEATMISQKS